MALAVISLKWVHREIHGKPPSPRQGHSACIIGDVAYIFGGIRSVDWPKRGTYFFRDLFQLHLYKRMQWEKVKQKGEVPQGRYGHHMCVIGHKIYVFGGKHELHADRCLPGLHVFDTEKKTWSKPQTSGTEPVAHGSTSSVIGNRIYIYGGLVDGQAVDDLHCFDSENQWWVKLTIQGVPPSPRCDSASTAVGNEMFVFGGTAGTDQWFNDIHVFNPKKLLWKELNKTDGEPPTPRGSHCFLAHVDKDIYVFGGSNDSNTTHPTLGDLYKFSLDKRKWKRPFFGGCPPAKRSGHAAIIHRSKLIIIGGSNEDTDFNDVHIAKLINPSKRQPLKVPAGDMHAFLNNINNSDPRPMVVDGEDADAHFHEKEDPEPISKEAEGSEVDQGNDQQTGSQAPGSREGSVAGSDADMKESPGRSVHFEDEIDGKQDAASLSSSAGSLASSAGSLSSSASASSGSSEGSSSSDSRGSDGPGSSNNNNSNNNNTAVDVRGGVKNSVRGGIVQQDMAKSSDGGPGHAIISKSDNGEKKGKANAADESRSQIVSRDNQVGDESIQSIQPGKPKLSPIANTETVAPVTRQGGKAGSKKKKPKKKKGDGTLVDGTQHPVPGEYRPYPPMDSHLQRFPEEVAWNHHPEDWRTLNSITHQPQEQPESDEESEGGSESENESGSGSGSGSSSEEEDSDGDDDDDGEPDNSDEGDGNQVRAPEAQNMNGYDETLSSRPASLERPGESSKDEAESEDEDGSGSGSGDDSGSDDDDEESGSDTGSESESGSGSEDESESEED